MKTNLNFSGTSPPMDINFAGEIFAGMQASLMKKLLWRRLSVVFYAWEWIQAKMAQHLTRNRNNGTKHQKEYCTRTQLEERACRRQGKETRTDRTNTLTIAREYLVWCCRCGICCSVTCWIIRVSSSVKARRISGTAHINGDVP